MRVWHEIFDFFHESVSPRPQSIPLGPFWIFSKIRRDILVDTGDKLFSSVNDTGEQFIAGVNPCHGEITKKPKNFAGVNDTTEKLFTGVNDTATVSTTLAIKESCLY
jgi:hypothetical protein